MLEFTQSGTQSLPIWSALLCALAALALGGALGFTISHYLRKFQRVRIEEQAEESALRRLAEEERSQHLAFLEEKDSWYELKADQEKEIETQVDDFNEKEKDLAGSLRELRNRRDEVRKEANQLRIQERRLGTREQMLRTSEEELVASRAGYRERLEVVANLSEEEAKEQLFEHLSGEVKARTAAMIRAERTKAREEADREARKIIAQAIQRCAVEEAEHASTSSVALPNEGIKSRIIGKEGRNVRAFETATGVKVVVDDTPDTVLLSAFDPVKREAAVIAMERLIKDGGFTPNRIEDIVAESKKAIESDMLEAGKKALKEIGARNCHPELPQALGRLKHRSSYGQNQLQHCLEVAQLSGLLAADIGLDARLAQRAGLLHDIGKTVSRELEGTHIDLGVEMAERFDEHPVVKEVIAEHHEDHERLDPICFIVKAADAISSIRPGGRREDPEGYARRMMKLEEIAQSFEGVKDVYAINAGREIRVMVMGEKVSDDDAEILAFDIAERVKNELTFPGEVKVMVVRETRSVRQTGRARNRRGNNVRRNGHRRSRNGDLQKK